MNKLKMNKFLLIGSAPYIKNWYRKYGLSLIKKGYKLCAINNAWAIDPKSIYIWIYPNDFFSKKDNLIPTIKQRQRMILIETKKQDILKPYMYKQRGKGSGTMLLNALIRLLNLSLNQGKKCIVEVAGCDCIYEGKKTHFYGKGSPDPLRYGKDWLIKELLRIEAFYKIEKCKLYNIGGRRKTLLPFKKRKPLSNEIK